MAMIREKDPAGLPIGTYDVYYYTLRGRDLVRDAGCDSSVSDGRVERLEVGPREMAQAICRSSPGGVKIFGSREVKEAWDRLPETAA